MSIDEVISGLLEKYPSSKDFIQTHKQYLASMVPPYFHGTIHAEATLMGLISYFSLGGREFNRRDLELSNRDTFEEIIQPVCCHLSFLFIANSLIFSGTDKPCYRRRQEMLLVLCETFSAH